MFNQDYGNDIYIFEEQKIQEDIPTLNFTTLEEFVQMSQDYQEKLQLDIYKYLKQIKNNYERNICIKELTNSLSNRCSDQLVWAIYNDILDDPTNFLSLQLLNNSIFNTKQIPISLLKEIKLPFDNNYTWEDKGDQIPYSNTSPTIFFFNNNNIIAMYKTLNKTDSKYQVDLMYTQEIILYNQIIYFDKSEITWNGQNLGKIIKILCYEQIQTPLIQTLLPKKLAQFGLLHSLFMNLSYQIDNQSRQNISMLLYECLLFENQNWCQKILTQNYLENLIDLSLNNKINPDIKYHQIVYDNYNNISNIQFTYQQTDQLLLRLYQYYEASQLDLKKIIQEPQKQNIIQKQKQKINQQKNSKPKGIGYGDITYTQSNNYKTQKKGEQSFYESNKIYGEIKELKWPILTLLFQHLSNNLNFEYIDLIEDSCLIPVIKSLVSQLTKVQQIDEKLNVYKYVHQLLQNILNSDQTIHLFTCKDYGDISLFEIFQKFNQESNFTQSNQTNLLNIIKQYSEFFNQMVESLQIQKYIEIKYEESGSEQITDPITFYPILMKPLALKTSEISKQLGWKKHMDQYFSQLATVPPNNKMNRLIKELSDITESLPLNITNSIFLRYDKDRMDVQQALIIGSSGTPYAHGAFLYNFLFCDDYPLRPPKCLLETTGHGKVRFNPNLYNCGKVCLSLLGTWGDNWKANESTLLQILISIQSMVMCEYVYFNEPGWEHSMGTPEGEQNNRGYCNIVKLANIRYAMIEQLQQPPIGFEEVIQKSFYLRKDAIITEIQQWIQEAHLPVNYNGSQNNNIAAPFIQFPEKFKQILITEFETLKKELEKLKICITHETDKKLITITNRISYQQILKQKKLLQTKKTQLLQQLLHSELPQIDVQETKTGNKLFNIESNDVQNLLSRYIGVMGLEAVNKQSQASVLLYGLNGLGIETAKNLTLSGLKRLTIVDDTNQNSQGQFFYINKNQSRLEQSLLHLQSLNSYVQVDSSTDIINSIESQYYQIVCLCHIESIQWAIQISNLCRQLKIGLILSQVCSVYGRVFVDLGSQFIVNDIDGEQVQEFIIDEIINDSGIIKTKNKHNLNINDIIELKEVIVTDGQSFNGKQFIVEKIIDKQSFIIGNINQYGKYIRNGRGYTIKQKVTIEFQEMSKILINPLFDPNFCQDEQKGQNINLIMNEQVEKQSTFEIFPPQAAYIGGITSQEIIKAITHKYMPIRQCYFHNCEELLEGNQILGIELQQAIKNCKLFMIGAGAIGCELLKNFAMIELGVNGRIIVTDPDVIEKSNLSRQFLFREKHIRQPKSYTAANACLQMNPNLKITARLDKISQLTEEQYGPVFDYVDVVTNALDNVQARLYVDSQCVLYMKPLLESGTLGPKGHVQVILPYLTENYGSKQDPEESNEIPYCTLKMFPEDSIHCLEWARDKFEKLFTTKIQQIRQTLQFKDITTESLEKTLKYCKQLPKTFKDCIQFALDKFYKYFNYGIQDLLKAYPLDHQVNGKLFWQSPKRPPRLLEFKGEEIQLKFIQSASKLYAQVVGIKIPENINFIEILTNLKPKTYKENKQKQKLIQDQVQKDQNKQEQDEKNNEINQKDQQELIMDIISIFKEYYEITSTYPKIIKELDFLPTPIIFEKDEDDNYHIDFIQSALNCRAQNYELETIDWLTTKLKAGRIVPAMATTTACIAALQTIELVKVIKKQLLQQDIKLDFFKNTFLNLAIPYSIQSEPGECQFDKINNQKVSFWSRWDIKLSNEINTLKKFIDYAQQKYNEKITCIKQKAKLLYSTILLQDDKERNERLQTPIYLLFDIQEHEEFVELDLIFTSKIKCRIYF